MAMRDIPALAQSIGAIPSRSVDWDATEILGCAARDPAAVDDMAHPVKELLLYPVPDAVDHLLMGCQCSAREFLWSVFLPHVQARLGALCAL